jgi:prepilin-type N-terminal cleavage/methylation domain-containing protein
MTAKIYKGFTLIELLIVIAILGVLAVVVLVAINPVQQLARTRDSGRISSVAQIGHAIEAYMASHNGTYPTTLTELSTSGELNAVPSEVGNTLGATLCSGGDGVENGWCYDFDVADFAVWTHLESETNKSFCGGAAAYVAYLSDGGKTCIGCSNPSSATTIAWCEN